MEAATVLLPARSLWRYWDRGPLSHDDTPAWVFPAFDDGLWRQGPGPLGYDDAAAAAGRLSGLSTIISAVDDRGTHVNTM